MYNYELDQRDQVINNISKATSPQELNQLKLNYSNSSLTSLVTDETELNRIIEIDGELIQQQDPIFKDASGIRGHFYAPRKQIFGNFYDTFWVNILVIWAMTFTLMVTLYFDFFRKLINIFDR